MSLNLNQEQMSVVTAKESFIIVNSAAASGKTQTLTARIAYLLSCGVAPSKIVVITFTNQAAAVLRKRLGEENTKGMYIGTVHGYCTKLLMAGGVDAFRYIEKEEFDALFEQVQSHPYCIEKIDYLFVDEAQDSSVEQFDFFDLIAPKNRMYVGDFHQAIYGFGGGSVDTFLSYMNSPNVKVYNLFKNYRNAPEILNFAKTLIRKNGRTYIDNSIPEVKESGRVILTSHTSENVKRVIDEIKNSKDYKNWFVLCRFNAQLEALKDMFNRAGVPFDSFRQSELTHKGLEEKMQANTVKLLTIHSAKGLEADNVAVIGAFTKTREETCVAYVGATRAKKTLYWFEEVKRRKPKTSSFAATSWET